MLNRFAHVYTCVYIHDTTRLVFFMGTRYIQNKYLIDSICVYNIKYTFRGVRAFICEVQQEVPTIFFTVAYTTKPTQNRETPCRRMVTYIYIYIYFK